MQINNSNNANTQFKQLEFCVQKGNNANRQLKQLEFGSEINNANKQLKQLEFIFKK